jgi:PRTRC genetic system protein C
MKVTALVRSFSYAGVTLPDPNPNLSPDQVRDVYSATYPELATATVEGPEARDGKMTYSFRRAAGMKGMAISTTEACVRQASELSERICIGCLLPDCNERSGLCLRAFLTESRTNEKMLDQALEAIDIRLNARDCDTMSMRVLIEARDSLRNSAAGRCHA